MTRTIPLSISITLLLGIVAVAALFVPTAAEPPPWRDLYCVANINRGSVAGHFDGPEDAIAELNRRPGGPTNRQMVCQIGPDWAVSSDDDFGVVSGPDSWLGSRQLRQDGRVGSDRLQDFWHGWNDVKMMAHMCEADCFRREFRSGQWRCRGKVSV